MVLGSDLRWGNARRGHGPRAAGRGTALTAALVLVLGPVLAACGDGGGGGAGPAPTPTADRTTSAPGSAPANRAEAEQEVKQNWEKFFDPATSLDDKKKLLEHGQFLGPVLEAFSGDKRGGQVKAEVTEVSFTSPTEADVKFALSVKGVTALPDASGKAVEDNGTWKVSVKSLCALVQLSGDGSPPAVPGC
ncbi:hypothetical protein [Streptomyces griseoloalbus]|uniref:Low molecular weight antigen MTB12-like C-terminal domain-containing protein n=1 Tax=Streptomyces griseoloalbus TaxID=67303 RepID=A0A7W8FDL9_9ACTN|nr:hypothetical protein [Streptomyces albaduncus]MBB5129616.1 hypothetical protein [Streptomyces albaduncus]GGV62950.1 hypothetical protein GCM10010294_14130 [Streptomyces griseoloalbus]